MRKIMSLPVSNLHSRLLQFRSQLTLHALEIYLLFSIPSDGANSTLLVRSDITLKGLMNQLADELSVAPKAVKVAYRFSIEPRSAPWSHLQNEGHLSDLLKKARTTIEKQKKSKSTRVFAVELKDLAPSITDVTTSTDSGFTAVTGASQCYDTLFTFTLNT